MEQQRKEKLIQLKNYLTQPLKDPQTAQQLQKYFLGVKGCACKAKRIIQALGNYYELYKNELDEN